MIDACLLGIGGFMPLPGRWLSALLLRSGRDVVLCDCGEGTQISWKETNWGFRDVATIVLSHLHADHVAGLPGILFMLSHAERTEPVTIYGPPYTELVVRGLRSIVPRLRFPLEIVEWQGGESTVLPGGLELRSLAVEHAIPCLSYSFTRSRAPRFAVERARELGVPVTLWSYLQRGETVDVEGRLVRPEEVLGAPRRGLKLTYVTDTQPTPALPGFAADSDLLVCEGMYGSPDHEERALERGHMTFQDAARIAHEAGARRLWLTHISPLVSDPYAYLPLARAIFPAAELGQPHQTLTLRYEE